jgi:hypothetical protein
MQNPTPEFARQMANAIRILAVDAVEKAKSGHPGAPDGYGRHCRGAVEPPPQAQPDQSRTGRTATALC